MHEWTLAGCISSHLIEALYDLALCNTIICSLLIFLYNTYIELHGIFVNSVQKKWWKQMSPACSRRPTFLFFLFLCYLFTTWLPP